jgi:hypothetical protein
MNKLDFTKSPWGRELPYACTHTHTGARMQVTPETPESCLLASMRGISMAKHAISGLLADLSLRGRVQEYLGQASPSLKVTIGRSWHRGTGKGILWGWALYSYQPGYRDLLGAVGLPLWGEMRICPYYCSPFTYDVLLLVSDSASCHIA